MTAAEKVTNGAALRALRKSRGLKFGQLAARLEANGAAKAGRSHLCNIEKGRRDASDELLAALATVLGVEVDALRRRPEGVTRDSAA